MTAEMFSISEIDVLVITDTNKGTSRQKRARKGHIRRSVGTLLQDYSLHESIKITARQYCVGIEFVKAAMAGQPEKDAPIKKVILVSVPCGFAKQSWYSSLEWAA